MIALSQYRVLAAVIGGCVAATLIGASLTASAQDQSAATAKDVIFARKTVMVTVSDNMDEIEGMIATNQIDLEDAHDHADNISTMLMAFPHLFPPSSNQWKPNVELDAARDTYASPDVWTNFADFYKRANDASKTAFDMSRAEKADDFKTMAAQLRTACNACHAAYLKQ